MTKQISKTRSVHSIKLKGYHVSIICSILIFFENKYEEVWLKQYFEVLKLPKTTQSNTMPHGNEALVRKVAEDGVSLEIFGNSLSFA